MTEALNPPANPLSLIHPELFARDGFTLLDEDTKIPIPAYSSDQPRPLYARVGELAQAANDAWHAVRTSRNVCLATNGEGGWPHPTVLTSGITIDGTEIEGFRPDDSFLFSSYPHSRHSRNVERDSRAALIVYASDLNQGSFSVERLTVNEVPYDDVPEYLLALNGIRQLWNLAPRNIQEYDPNLPLTLRLYIGNFYTIMLPVRGLTAVGRHINNAMYPVPSRILGV